MIERVAQGKARITEHTRGTIKQESIVKPDPFLRSVPAVGFEPAQVPGFPGGFPNCRIVDHSATCSVAATGTCSENCGGFSPHTETDVPSAASSDYGDTADIPAVLPENNPNCTPSRPLRRWADGVVPAPGISAVSAPWPGIRRVDPRLKIPVVYSNENETGYQTVDGRPVNMSRINRPIARYRPYPVINPQTTHNSGLRDISSPTGYAYHQLIQIPAMEASQEQARQERQRRVEQLRQRNREQAQAQAQARQVAPLQPQLPDSDPMMCVDCGQTFTERTRVGKDICRFHTGEFSCTITAIQCTFLTRISSPRQGGDLLWLRYLQLQSQPEPHQQPSSLLL